MGLFNLAQKYKNLHLKKASGELKRLNGVKNGWSAQYIINTPPLFELNIPY